jgi:predicted transposase YdaD
MSDQKNEISTVEKPHDKLVRRLLSNTTAAREILESFLPAEVKKLLDLNDLERQPDTFVDSRHRFLDL